MRRTTLILIVLVALAGVAVAGVSSASIKRGGLANAITADQPGWQKALNARSDALNRRYGLGKYAPGRKVTVRITFKNDGQDSSDGSVAGAGHFTAAGAITDKGTVAIYRTVKDALITLRYVTVGTKGTITFVVKIDTNLATSRWTITSATKAYKGLHGKGTERENPPKYTISTLTGTVWG